MGNIFSSNEKSWIINQTDNDPSVKVVDATYDQTESAIVNVTGPVALDCVIEVHGATIEIDGDGHLVTIRGDNNTITVSGSQAQIRISGKQNTLSGSGVGTILYTDDQVDVDDVVLAGRESFDAVASSPQVDTQDDDDVDDDDEEDEENSNSDNNDLQKIRIVYVPRDNGGGGGDAPSGNANVPTNHSSRQLPTTGVKREANDSDDENTDADSERKRARTN